MNPNPFYCPIVNRLDFKDALCALLLLLRINLVLPLNGLMFKDGIDNLPMVSFPDVLKTELILLDKT